MADQVYWDDVTEGMELPEVVKNPTTQQLVKYAGASGDYYQIHYDQSFARNNDLEDVILHGALKNAFLGHLVTKWMGQDGDLKRLAVQYRGMDIPGTPVTAKGVVTPGGSGWMSAVRSMSGSRISYAQSRKLTV